jgi:hypothetical protein
MHITKRITVAEKIHALLLDADGCISVTLRTEGAGGASGVTHRVAASDTAAIMDAETGAGVTIRQAIEVGVYQALLRSGVTTGEITEEGGL